MRILKFCLLVAAVPSLALADTVGGINDNGQSRWLHTTDGGELYTVPAGTTMVAGADGGLAAVSVVTTPDPAAPASCNITAADVASTTTTGQGSQSIIAGTPTANSTCAFALNGTATIRVEVSGTWSATLATEISMDGATTWATVSVHLTGTSLTTSSATADLIGNLNVSGATNFRVRATAYTSGTAVARIQQSQLVSAIYTINPTRILDGSGTSTVAKVLPASTAAGATDPALVVAISPNNGVGKLLPTTWTFGEVAVSNSSATAVPATPLTGRSSLLIQNNGPNDEYCGFTNAVTTATGVKVERNGGQWSDDTIGGATVYCKALTAAQTGAATPSTATHYEEH